MIHEKEEQSLIIIKPDAVQRNLIGKVITRFEEKGLKIIGLKMVYLKDALVEEHYAHIADKPFFPGIKKFMQSAPVVVIAVAGIRAVDAIRIIVGPTKGFDATAGTIRGDYSLSTQSAKIEIARFFDDKELLDYDKVDTRFIFADDLL